MTPDTLDMITAGLLFVIALEVGTIVAIVRGVAGRMTDTAPCPYHDPAKPDCGHLDRCPLYLYEEYVVCTTLTPMQILAVRSWVEGNVPEKPEEGAGP